MKLISFVDPARRWSENLVHHVRGLAARNREEDEPTSAELWADASSELETALASYDKKNSSSLPDDAWLGDSKTKCQKDIDEAIDAVILVLGKCGAVECRRKIRALQDEVADSRSRLVQYREQSVSAPPEASLSPPRSLWTRSRESFEEAVAAELSHIGDMRHQIAQLKDEFRNHLQSISLDVSPEEADSLLLPVQDDIVSMAGVVTNVARVTAQLERLVEETKELPAHSRRYYGIYVLLVYAIGRIQTHFVKTVDETYLPKLRTFEQSARENIADARSQIGRGGPRELLSANADAGKVTIDACKFLTEALRRQRTAIAQEIEYTNRMFAAAANTYRTVQLSLNVAELITDCQSAFRALRELQVPRLRPFQNVALKDELQRLAERMLNEGE